MRKWDAIYHGLPLPHCSSGQGLQQGKNGAQLNVLTSSQHSWLRYPSLPLLFSEVPSDILTSPEKLPPLLLQWVVITAVIPHGSCCYLVSPDTRFPYFKSSLTGMQPPLGPAPSPVLFMLSLVTPNRPSMHTWCFLISNLPKLRASYIRSLDLSPCRKG